MSPWHASHDSLVQFATRPEEIGVAQATSIETHLERCPVCRAVIAEHVEGEWLEQSWLALADVVDRPKRTHAERALGWFVSDSIARVVASTRSLRWAWVTAVAIISFAVSAFARDVESVYPFLLIAPALPVIGVGLTFHPVPDPAGEAALATPMHGAGLVLYRALAVLFTTFAGLAPAALVLPQVGLWNLAWLLPALALTGLTLGLCTWLAPEVAVGVVTVAWIAVVYAAGVAAFVDGDRFIEVFFGPVAQLAWFALAALAALAVALRRDHFSMLEAR